MSDTDERYDDTYGVDEQEPAEGSPAGRAFRALLVLVVSAVALGVSGYWVLNPPKATRRPPRSEAIRVEVREVTRETEPITVHAMGTVVPATEVQLASRVGGELVHVDPHFVPGGRFDAGDVILRVDPKDYELAVRQRRSALTKAESDLTLEMGQQEVSKREYELLGQDLKGADKALVLRQPQLEAAKAACESARAELEDAELDLARTKVKAPFNAMVRDTQVDLGSQVSVGSTLGSLVGTDKYWVQVQLPLSQLQWIRVPGTNSKTGSSARVTHESAWGKTGFRTGVVERLMANVEPQGRMARLLVAVENPLGLGVAPERRHPLVLGAYVRVAIQGRDLPDVVRVDRTALHDGHYVWVMNKKDKLEIREVTIAWSGNDHVCVSRGLNPGDRVVTSDLGTPVSGMALRTGDAKPKPPGGPTTGPGQARKPEAPK